MHNPFSIMIEGMNRYGWCRGILRNGGNQMCLIGLQMYAETGKLPERVGTPIYDRPSDSISMYLVRAIQNLDPENREYVTLRAQVSPVDAVMTWNDNWTRYQSQVRDVLLEAERLWEEDHINPVEKVKVEIGKISWSMDDLREHFKELSRSFKKANNIPDYVPDELVEEQEPAATRQLESANA